MQTKPHHLLTGGETIGSLLAISTPGHTPGSMSFLDTRNGTIIAGDAFQLRGGIAVSGQIKWAFPFPEFDTWNKEEAIKVHNCSPIRRLPVSLLDMGIF